MKHRHALEDRLLAAQSELRRRLQDAVPPNLLAEFAEFGGITLHQMEVVRRLLLGDEMTMHDVAAALGIGPSGATQLVDRLARRGLVIREQDPRDRRVQRVLPTDRARAIARRFKAGMSRAAGDLLGVLDDAELKTYVELTERIAAAPREHARQCEQKATA
jgi:DNA-binding MarR family transcriptional regulator